MPFRKFRIFDVKENALASDDFYICYDGTLSVWESSLLYIFDDGALETQFQTPFTDAEGTPIYQGDQLFIPHTGQLDAVRTGTGMTLTANWDEAHGQWAVYENLPGRVLKVAPLWQYARKGTIVKQQKPEE